MNDMRIKNIYNFCKLIDYDCIKKELDDYLTGFNLDTVNCGLGTWDCYFSKENGNSLTLMISRYEIHLIRHLDNYIEQVRVNENLVLTHRSIEKRKNGIIYSVVNKEFGKNNKYRNENILINLMEKRYVFTKSTLEALLNRLDFENVNLNMLLLKLKKVEQRLRFDKHADFCSEFSTYMDVCFGNRCFSWLNGEELKMFNDIKSGFDKLYRIYDLYRGVINSRNTNDIDLISKGKISSDIYNVRELMGITAYEDTLIGEDERKSCGYLMDRESVLDTIMEKGKKRKKSFKK